MRRSWTRQQEVRIAIALGVYLPPLSGSSKVLRGFSTGEIQEKSRTRLGLPSFVLALRGENELSAEFSNLALNVWMLLRVTVCFYTQRHKYLRMPTTCVIVQA